MGKRESRHIERRLLNASSLRSELRTLRTPVVDDATVDCPRDVFICISFWKCYIHVGVGFGVAYLYREASSKARNVG